MLIINLEDILRTSFLTMKYRITDSELVMEHDKKNSVARIVKDNMRA